MALWVMNTSFGFMAFLGIASLIGVIVSHVIVLFDFIEEMHAKGEPFEQAVIDATWDEKVKNYARMCRQVKVAVGLINR